MTAHPTPQESITRALSEHPVTIDNNSRRRCACGDLIATGPFFSPEDEGAWYEAHDEHVSAVALAALEADGHTVGSAATLDYGIGYKDGDGFAMIGLPHTFEGSARAALANLAGHGTFGVEGRSPAVLIRRSRGPWQAVES